MNPEIFQMLIDDIKRNKFKTLTIEEQIDKEQFPLFRDALSVTTTLKTLIFKKPAKDILPSRVGDHGAACIAEALMANKSITNLDLSRSCIFNGGVEYLAQALRVNTTLISLNLSCNPIDKEGATYLANALKINKSLTSLNLSGCRIGNRGSHALADMMIANDTINYLGLDGNPIKKSGILYLVNTLSSKQTGSSVQLGLHYMKISDQKVKNLTDIAKRRGNLSLEISNKNKGDTIGDWIAISILTLGVLPLGALVFITVEGVYEYTACKEYNHRQLQKPTIKSDDVVKIAITSKPSNASSFFNSNNKHLPQEETVVEVKENVKPERKSSTKSLP